MKLITRRTAELGKVIDITGQRPTAVDRHVAEIIISNSRVIKDKRTPIIDRKDLTPQEMAEARPPQRLMTDIGIALRMRWP